MKTTFLCALSILYFGVLFSQNSNVKEFIDVQIEFYESLSEEELDQYNQSKEIKTFTRFLEHVEAKITNSETGSSLNEYYQSYRNILSNLSTYKSGDGVINPEWEDISPRSLETQNMGRIECVTTPQGSNMLQTMYAGAPSSGIWKTIDGGEHWVNITDSHEFASGFGCSHIVIDPSDENHLYAAINMSSTDQFNEVGLYGFGIGIYESLDAGENWSPTSVTFDPTSGDFAHRIEINPENSLQMYAFGNDKVYRTNDGWQSYQIIFEDLITQSGGGDKRKVISDLSVRPENFDAVFVSTTGQGIDGLFYPAELWRTYGGMTLFPNWDPIYAFSDSFEPSSDNTTPLNLELDFSGSNFFVAERDNNDQVHIHRSGIVGEEYITIASGISGVEIISSPNPDFGGMAQNLAVFEVSPTDKNIFYIGGIKFSYSSYGTLVSVPYMNSGNHDLHADMRYLEFVQSSSTDEQGLNDIILCGNDGGVSLFMRNESNELVTINKNGEGLGNLQYYGLDISNEKKVKIAGGAQDNGAYAKIDDNWKFTRIGDAYDALLAFDNSGMGVIFNNGGMMGTSDFGEIWGSMTEPDIVGGGCGFRNCDGPMIKDPKNSDVYYVGHRQVYQGSFENNDWVRLTELEHDSGKVRSIAVNPSNTNYKYVAYNGPQRYPPSTEPRLIYTNDNAQNWIDLSALIETQLNWKGIAEVISHPRDPNILYVSFNGISNGDGEDRIFRIIIDESNILSSTVEDISLGLPDVPLNCVQFMQGSSNNLLAGNDVGVYMYNGSSWNCISQSLPVCPISDIEVDYENNKLYISTYGRGIWRANLDCIQNDAIVISEDETWDYDGILIDRNVHVLDGATLTITSKVNLTEHTAIKVEQGGKLIVDGGYLTNACPSELWQGIEVWGDPSKIQNDYNQGVCELRNAKIENAHTGVWLRKNTDDDCQLVPGFGGGILKATDSEFYNCYIGSEFDEYRWYGTSSPAPNRSYFKNCTFSIDRELFGGFEMKYGIHLKNVNLVSITGCDFRNDINGFAENGEENTADFSPQGIGIKSSNATFIAHSRCSEIVGPGQSCPESSMDRNNFINLDFGIYATSVDEMQTFSVKNSAFRKCAYGIKAKNVKLATIENNTFNVNTKYFMNLDIPSYGTHLIGCSQYTIENNEFHSSSSNPENRLGIVITDTNVESDGQDDDGDYNYIYRNNFHDLFCATLAQGQNADGAGVDIGLELLCGQYTNNKHHIALTNEGRIELFQGSAEEGAGNHFYTQTPDESTLYVQTDDGSEAFRYFHFNEFEQTPIPDSYTPAIEVNELDILSGPYEETCPVIPSSSHPDHEIEEYHRQKVKLLEASASLESRVDGGDTQRLLDYINNPRYSSYQVRNYIYRFSPYISKEVLIAVLNRPYAMENWHKADILIANSPLEFEVLDAYYAQGTLGDFFHELIMFYQAGENRIDVYREAKKEAASRKRVAQSRYLKRILTDLNGAYSESNQLEAVIDQNSETEDVRIRFDRALQTKDYTTAQTLIDTYTGDPTKDGFVSIAEIMLERSQNATLDMLTTNQVSSLENVATSDKRGKYLAQSMLEVYNEMKFEEEIVLPSVVKSYSPPRERKEITKLNLFDVYPNPASDYAYFTFKLPEGVENAFLTIYDNSGKRIEVIDLTSHIHVYRYSVSGLPLGNYSAVFEVDGRLISTKKLFVTR